MVQSDEKKEEKKNSEWNCIKTLCLIIDRDQYERAIKANITDKLTDRLSDWQTEK